MPDPIPVTAGWYALIAVFGLVFGSFINVVIYRLPKRLHYVWQQDCREFLGKDAAPASDTTPPPGIVFPASRCPHCQHPIRPQHNIPVISYLFLRGRCADCGTPIGIRYPVVEILTAIVTCVVIWRFGLTPSGIAAMVLSYALLALAFIDYDHQLLPDDVTYPGIWLGLSCNLFSMFTSLSSAVIGAVAGYLVLWLVYHGFRLVTGKEGMGYGDFKLLALLGAWLGWQALPAIIILAAGVASVLGIGMILSKKLSRDTPVPFGPFLAAAGWLVLIWGYVLLPKFLPFLHR